MIFVLVAGILGFQPGDSMQQVEFLRLSYKANKDAFEFGTFRFEFTRGTCASRADAESGVFSRAIKEAGCTSLMGKTPGTI